MALWANIVLCWLPMSTCILATRVADVLRINITQVTKLEMKEWNTHSSGEVRCFCNLPVCVTTGYMCKSEGNGCFSDFMDYNMDVYKATHGCIELLASDRHEQCHNQPGPGVSNHGRQKSLLLCCHKDMCNHVDIKESRLRFNDTFLGSTVNSSEGARLYFNGVQNSAASYNNEVWFKAATIAVPICGAVILFVLIALAVKILRKDSIEQGLVHCGKHNGMFPHNGHAIGLGPRKPAHDHLHFHRNAEMSSKKVPLLLQHHNEAAAANISPGVTLVSPISGLQYEKNEANAKLNFAGNSGSQRSQPNDYTLLVHPQIQNPQNSSMRKPNNSSSNNLYRNVNLAVAVPTPQCIPVDGKLYDKQPLTSVVSWGNASESASHV